jgi:hypothetical protein
MTAIKPEPEKVVPDLLLPVGRILLTTDTEIPARIYTREVLLPPGTAYAIEIEHVWRARWLPDVAHWVFFCSVGGEGLWIEADEHNNWQINPSLPIPDDGKN